MTALSTLVVVAGTVGVLTGARSGAWVIVGGLCLGSASSIAIALVAYRRTMRRPWPQVAPLADDDDWDD
jgi:ABC-type thiamin/hydroxymethylpyrimidine transport system permease subunit